MGDELSIVFNNYIIFVVVLGKNRWIVKELMFVLNSRRDFNVVKITRLTDSPASDIVRTSYFYQLIRYSYASGLTSYGSQPHDM